MSTASRPLRIQIVNERLLPRFGVDRLLVMLGRHLAAAGHEVSFCCLRCDRTMLDPFAAGVTVLDIPEGLGIAAMEDAVAAGTYMESVWDTFLGPLAFPEPYCETASKHKVNVNIDPNFGLSGGPTGLPAGTCVQPTRST